MRQPITEQQLMQIYWETIEPLYGYASRRCGSDRELAEDVTQEVWLRAIREWRTRGVPESPLGWLTTVARNLIIDQLRRAEPISLDAVPPASEVLAIVDRNDIADSPEITLVVSNALLRLPKKEAQLLESFHFERRKVAELAALYGTTERAIEGRLRRARERLRNELTITLKAAGDMA